jgi:hypothetical protein
LPHGNRGIRNSGHHEHDHHQKQTNLLALHDLSTLNQSIKYLDVIIYYCMHDTSWRACVL